MKKLEDAQVEAFDTEYVDDVRWQAIKSGIDQSFPSGEFTFIDVGGGNGKFADRVLSEYPNAKGTVLDSSEVLISRNQASERKTLIIDSVENLGHIDASYDIIFLHWLLHHVVSDSYAHTRRNQTWTLNTAREHLNTGGLVSVFENCYDGLLIDNLPGLIIYLLTSCRALSGITRKLGANTAGVGVCFLSKKEWLSSFHEAGLEVLSYAEPDAWFWSLPPARRILLHIQCRYVGQFWLGTPKLTSHPE
jgi:hypothetical protein